MADCTASHKFVLHALQRPVMHCVQPREFIIAYGYKWLHTRQYININLVWLDIVM